MTPTPEQLAIVEAAVTLPDNLQVVAYAGAAKTTTLRLICEALSGTPILSVAFNKRIAEEMATKLPGHVKSATLNSIGHRVWATTTGKRLYLESSKTFKLLSDATKALKGKAAESVRSEFPILLRAIDAAVTAGVLPPGKYPQAESLVPVDDFLDTLDDLPDNLHLVWEVLHQRIQQSYAGTIDFGDQIYMPALFGGTFPRFPLVLVDEAQDLSPINHRFVERLVSRRLIVVGDPYQSIYGFRGAVNSGMDVLAAKFSMRRLTLSVSFRCPQRVVEAAHFRVPAMRAAPNAPAGEVLDLPEWNLASVPPNSAIICRRNAPIFSLGFAFIRAGKPFNLRGSDMGPGIIRLFKSFGPLNLPQEKVLTSIDGWLAEALARRPKRADVSRDRAACLRIIASHGTDLGGAIAYAERLFASTGTVTLSTIHKAKGLEWDTVYHLDPWIIQLDDDQDANCAYVAITRAKSRYVTVNLKDLQS